MEDGKSDVSSCLLVLLSLGEGAFLSAIIEPFDSRFDDDWLKHWARSNDELIGPSEYVITGCSLNTANLSKNLATYSCGEGFFRRGFDLLLLDIEESIDNGRPVRGEAEGSVLLGADLLIHESHSCFKCVELVPGLDEPAGDFASLIPVFLQ